MRRYFFFPTLMFLTGSLALTGQNPYIQHLTTKDGLPSNTVYYVYQDSRKFLWFATDAGVVKYDGSTFTNFRKKDGLTSNEVIRIKEDSFDRIWFMNYNGALNYYYINKIFNEGNMPFLDSLKGRTNYIDFYQDNDQAIFFYNTLGDIMVLDKNNIVKTLKYEQDTNGIRFISGSIKGELILWKFRSIISLNKSSGKQIKISDHEFARGVFPCGNNKFYANQVSFGHSKFGLIIYNGVNEIGSIKMPFKLPYSGIKIRSVIDDTEGFLWIVTFDEGVFCMKENKVILHLDIRQGQSILQDHENHIWITSMNDGVYKIDRAVLVHKHYENRLFDNRMISALCSDPGAGVWLTNGEQIYLLRNTELFTLNSKSENNSLNFVNRVKNVLIIGEKGFTIHAFEDLAIDQKSKKIFFERIIIPQKVFRGNMKALKNIAIDNTGEEIGSYRETFLLTFSTAKLFREKQEINIGSKIFNVFYDAGNELIINSQVNYVFRNNKLLPCKELSLFNNRIITDHLLLNNYCELYNIEGDSLFIRKGDVFINLTANFTSPIETQIKKVVYEVPVLYFSTSGNVFKIENPLKKTDNGPFRPQLIDISFSNIHDILVKNDSLYVASDDGLTVIPEIKINNIPSYTPIPYIQSIFVNDQEMDVTSQDIKIKGIAKIRFIFGRISYSSIPMDYSYKLDGIDTSWNIAKSRTVIYENLPRGKYVFQMRVRKPMASWSEPVVYQIQIKGVFWRHPLFFAAIVIVLLFTATFAIIRRKNLQIRQREMDYQLITLEQKALQSMMNPHFIFNSLGSIQNFLLQRKTSEAGLYLSQFARLIRQNLNAVKVAMISLDDETERLKNYLDLEKMRLKNKFEYRFETDESIEPDEVLIPSMLVQPLVENAIWHGISPIEEMGSIMIRFRRESELTINVTVEDNGVGMKKAETYSTNKKDHLRLTLDLTRKRIDLLGKKFKVPASIEFFEAFPGRENPGTRVEMIVPFTNSELQD